MLIFDQIWSKLDIFRQFFTKIESYTTRFGLKWLYLDTTSQYLSNDIIWNVVVGTEAVQTIIINI